MMSCIAKIDEYRGGNIHKYFEKILISLVRDVLSPIAKDKEDLILCLEKFLVISRQKLIFRNFMFAHKSKKSPLIILYKGKNKRVVPPKTTSRKTQKNSTKRVKRKQENPQKSSNKLKEFGFSCKSAFL